MRTMRVEVEGRNAWRRAAFTRDGGNVIVAIWDGGMLDHTHVVGAGQTANLDELARQVQHALDGYIGTVGDVADYARVIQMLAD